MKSGKSWQPRYRPLHNSLTEEITDPTKESNFTGNNREILLSDNWCLYSDALFFDRSENGDTRPQTTNILTTIQQETTNITIQNVGKKCIGDLTPPPEPVITGTFLPDVPYSVEQVNNAVNSARSAVRAHRENLSLGPCDFDFSRAFTAFPISVDDPDFLISIPLDIETVSNFVGDEEGNFTFSELLIVGYQVGIQSTSPQVDCQIPVFNTITDNPILERQISRGAPDWVDSFLAVIPANNNYWQTEQTQTPGLGDPISLYTQFALPRDPLINDLVILPTRLGSSASFQVKDTPKVDDNSNRTDSPFSYFDCDLESEVNLSYASSRTTNIVRTARFNRDTAGDQDFWIQLQDPNIFIDRYYLANNGTELDIDMPDSIRMKEIHTALNAGLYGDGTVKEDPFRPLFIPEPLDSIQLRERIKEDPEFKVTWTDLPDFLNQRIRFISILLGLDLLPLDRPRTYKTFKGSVEKRNEETDTLASLLSYLVTVDRELQLKTGLWPQATYNYARVDDEGKPELDVYPGIADLLSDIFALLSRTQLNSERSALSSYRTDINVIEVARAIGTPFVRDEVPWDDGGLTDVLKYSGNTSLAAALTEIGLHLATHLPDFLPDSFYQQVEERLRAINDNSQN
ncbi:MAG: hypothetical protein HC924_15975 [Synechococcaceae cyanobacterium SM2_3_2]|nr:hypothetical protein [Synechococcaceae cyanobacterium SM2_3_2]